MTQEGGNENGTGSGKTFIMLNNSESVKTKTKASRFSGLTSSSSSSSSSSYTCTPFAAPTATTPKPLKKMKTSCVTSNLTPQRDETPKKSTSTSSTSSTSTSTSTASSSTSSSSSSDSAHTPQHGTQDLMSLADVAEVSESINMSHTANPGRPVGINRRYSNPPPVLGSPPSGVISSFYGGFSPMKPLYSTGNSSESMGFYHLDVTPSNNSYGLGPATPVTNRKRRQEDISDSEKIPSDNSQMDNFGSSQSSEILTHLQSQPQLQHSQSGGPVKKKSCKCKNSKCLKLYCECFAAGVYCSDCSCKGCLNNEENVSVVAQAVSITLERNPGAFKPKIHNTSRSSSSSPGSQNKSGAHHARGCHCRRSGCLKKYCECFQAGILCSDLCKCRDCKNYEGSFEREQKLAFVGNNSSQSDMSTSMSMPMSEQTYFDTGDASNSPRPYSFSSSRSKYGSLPTNTQVVDPFTSGFPTPAKNSSSGVGTAVGIGGTGAAALLAFAGLEKENPGNSASPSVKKFVETPKQTQSTLFLQRVADIMQTSAISALCRSVLSSAREALANKKSSEDQVSSRDIIDDDDDNSNTTITTTTTTATANNSNNNNNNNNNNNDQEEIGDKNDEKRSSKNDNNENNGSNIINTVEQAPEGSNLPPKCKSLAGQSILSSHESLSSEILDASYSRQEFAIFKEVFAFLKNIIDIDEKGKEENNLGSSNPIKHGI